MSDREKLIELFDEANKICVDTDCCKCSYAIHGGKCVDVFFKDYFISNEVTVGADTKPLKQYLTQIDEYAGLKLKFLVFKADTGERIENCFVLRPDKDPAAVEALRAYANATDNKTLAEDIYNWVGKGVTVQKWIPVSERLPVHGDSILCYTKYREISVFRWDSAAEKWLTNTWDYSKDRITHWMPLPEPPKECE